MVIRLITSGSESQEEASLGWFWFRRSGVDSVAFSMPCTSSANGGVEDMVGDDMAVTTMI